MALHKEKKNVQLILGPSPFGLVQMTWIQCNIVQIPCAPLYYAPYAPHDVVLSLPKIRGPRILSHSGDVSQHIHMSNQFGKIKIPGNK